LEGFEEQKPELIQEGAEIYATASVASNKAEDEMIKIRQKCR